MAQDAGGQQPSQSAPEEAPVAFEADSVEYDDNSDEVSASGDVLLRRDGQAVRADAVTWNRKSGVIVNFSRG